MSQSFRGCARHCAIVCGLFGLSRMAWFDQLTFSVWSSAFRRLFKDLPPEERPRKRGTPNTPARTFVGRAAPSCLAALSLGWGGVAMSQDQNIAPPNDVIFARKMLMDAIGTNMEELEGLVRASKIELDDAKDRADTISVMLMSFPHLFPPGTNQWKPNAVRDRGRDTFAAPEVWSNYADFYKRADAASKIAYNASRSDDEEELKKYAAELRNACDSCHAIYVKNDHPR